MQTPKIKADLMISGATLITMNSEHQVITDGALAIRGDTIVAVGKDAQLQTEVDATRIMDGRQFVVTPGFVDGHIHITCDPITGGFARGPRSVDPRVRMSDWVLPLFKSQTPAEEAISASLAAVNMLKGGTTLFMEAGTVIHFDAVMEALAQTGLRGRVGRWVEGRAYSDQQDQAALSRTAISLLEDEIARYSDQGADTLLAGWPVLVGHSTNSDDVWRAAAQLAQSHNLRVSAHMSPSQGDPNWFLGKYGRRPIEHLYDLGVLGERICITHLVEIDESELECLVETGTNGIHCPFSSFPGGVGLSQSGLFPEMMERGMTVMLGTDGKPADILNAARMMAGVFRDARRNPYIIDDGAILELATLNGARAMGMDGYLGSIEVGKKADFLLHDTHTAPWGPVFDPVLQLAQGASQGRVHSAFIQGVQVVENGRCTLIDEEKIICDARQAGLNLVGRTGLQMHSAWPII